MQQESKMLLPKTGYHCNDTAYREQIRGGCCILLELELASESPQNQVVKTGSFPDYIHHWMYSAREQWSRDENASEVNS